MSRVINTDSPGKLRNQLLRTCAELLRHLSQKQTVDDEAKDMASFVVLCLQQISEGIESSSAAWEKRDYWMKAEKLRQRWAWVDNEAYKLERTIREEAWDRLPASLLSLFPHFADIKVTRFTRSADLWAGAYEKLISETA